MSWKETTTAHKHVDDGYEYPIGPVCLILVCNNCGTQHEIDAGIIGHWEPDDKATALDVAADDYELGWAFEGQDVAYCGECRYKVAHTCQRDDEDDPCRVCHGFAAEVA